MLNLFKSDSFPVTQDTYIVTSSYTSSLVCFPGKERFLCVDHEICIIPKSHDLYTGCLPNQGIQGNQGNACRLKNIREKSGNSAKSGENQGKIREIVYLQK